LEETLQAKLDFKTMAERLGVKIRNYHINNGRFTENGFVLHSKTKGQGLTYCGVHTNFQNGIAERKIRDL
jgi:hypothetical protein